MMPDFPPPERPVKSALQRGIERSEDRSQPKYRITMSYHKLSGAQMWLVEQWEPWNFWLFMNKGFGRYEPMMQPVYKDNPVPAKFYSKAEAENFLSLHIAGLPQPSQPEYDLYFNAKGERVRTPKRT